MIKKIKKPFMLLLVLVMLFSFMPTGSVSAADNTGVIDILSFNDFHGALDPSGKNQGVAKLVAEVNNYKAINPDTYVVSGGDNFNGSAASNLLYGAPVVDMFHEIGAEYSALGNHEYDWGLSHILDWESQGIQFLSCNIVNKSDDSVPGYVKPYAIKKIGGLNVAFVGLTTPQTVYTALPANVAAIKFLDPAAAAKTAVTNARAAGANVVILLAHIGSYQNSTNTITFETYIDGTSAAGLVDTGADAIITAHSHNEVCGTVTNSAGAAIPVVQAYYNGRDLADLNIVYDKDNGKVISITPKLDKMYAADHLIITPDAAAAAKLAASESTVAPILNQQLGTSNVDLVRNDYTISNMGEWATSTMLIADAAAGTPADISTQNAHGLRVDLPAGQLTMGDMYNVMPFDNVLTNVKMTGADVYALFTYGLNGAIGSGLGQMQYNGCKVYYHTDPVKVILDPLSNAVKDNNGNTIPVRVIDSIVLDSGRMVVNDKSNTYIIATNDFMATGGDNYVAFLNGTVTNAAGNIRDIMADNVKAAGTLKFEQAGRLLNVLSTLDVTTTANLVKKGDYFDVTASFLATTTANAVSFVLAYDQNKFEYAGNLGADPSQPSYIDGVTYLTSDVGDGNVKFTIMIPDYKAKNLVSLRFRAKENVETQNGDNSITATANFVYKTSEGKKYVYSANGSTDFTTGGTLGDTDDDGKVTLLDLSNVIDMFGVKNGDALWKKAKFYDFNKNKVIDIADIVTVAKLIF